MSEQRSLHPLTDDCRFVPDPDNASRNLPDGMVFVQLRSGEFFSSAGLGPKIWELLCDGLSFGEIVATIEQRYPEAKKTIRRDLHAFVNTLLEHGLLRKKG